MNRPRWTTSRSISVASPSTTRRSSRSPARARRTRRLPPLSAREDGRTRARRRDDRRRRCAVHRSSTPCALALAAGATNDEIVATLEAVTPVTGDRARRPVRPKLALALGYDVEAALEQLDE